MYFFIEKTNELTEKLKNSFSEYFELVEDVWSNTNSKMYEKYDMPALHLWEDGYCKGDATEDELISLADRVKADYPECNFYDETDENLFVCLDREFISIYEEEINAVLEKKNSDQ